jgi:hypothetical protein
MTLKIRWKMPAPIAARGEIDAPVDLRQCHGDQHHREWGDHHGMRDGNADHACHNPRQSFILESEIRKK